MTIIYALAGALLLIAIQIKAEKDKRDKDHKQNKKTWGQFIAESWDDFLFAIICAVLLGWLQDPVFSALIHLQKWNPDYAWEVYYDTEYLISAALGVFGTLIIQKVYSLGSKLIRSK